MKKIFIEPEIVRIDLKMTENIADSSSGQGFRAWPYYQGGTGFGIIVTTRIGNDSECFEYVFNEGFWVPPSRLTLDDAWNARLIGCYINEW